MKKIKSLKSELFFRLVVPLVCFVILDIAMTYVFTFYYVNEAYDRWLLDSAKSLTQEIRVQSGEAVVELPPAALAIFKWDELDKTYFKIVSSQKGVLAGDPSVPEPKKRKTDRSRSVFYEDEMYGEPVRIVSVRIDDVAAPDKIAVYVAETRNKRRTMMRDIFLADLVPQILLIVVTAAYLSAGLRKGLQPLHDLAAVIAERSPKDLEPIPETHVFLEAQTLANTINGLFERLALAIASQQRFVANAAHQLRTPLAGLKLQAERARREQDLVAMKPALAKIEECADRLSHLTTQLLVLARSEPVSGSPELNRVDLSALVREICIDWVPKALHRKIELGYEGPDRAVYVRGDRILLGELLANLLDNAIAYGFEHGNILVKLEAGLRPRLVVEDDGPGMAPDELSKVFERFYRIPGSQGNGCGLGLAIVKEIADLHQARIAVSRAGDLGGTRVELVFNHRSE
ncbi:sensor histidine kinase [Methylosarcina fibrata]|uniref:sensor histidine kinase n=1 Tax=Methylosarcina fibrata TaxID=105972 RepID=UPI0003692C04|nr:sensor histidine kinase [Methylosarcina fibrata]